MIEEQGRVIAVHGDIAEIVTERQTVCGGCAVKGGCGTSLLAAWFPQRRLTFRLHNAIGAGAGDTVVVGLDERFLQRGALLLYALPLAGLLIGAVLGEFLSPGLGIPVELGAVAAGLLGLATALQLVRRLTLDGQQAGDQGVRLLRVARRSTGVAPEDIRSSGVRQQE